MMKKKEKSHATEILELLESDDELPDSYIENSDIPAYQDDHRFDPCDPTAFKWLQQKLNDDSNITQTRNVLEHCNNVETLQTEEDSLLNKQILVTNEETTNTQSTDLKKNKNKILISKGVLSKRNIFLIKSIEQYSTDTTLL